jgi:DNA-binding transcriptional regulator of glucitol operon
VRRLLSPRWVLVHLTVLVLVAGFLALGWWQVNRAAEGNLLSYGYAVEWPVFAAFVVVVWVVEMRKAVRAIGIGQEPVAPSVPEDVPSKPSRKRNEAAYDDSEDPQLAAYNHYLAWLNAHPYASRADYPGMTDSITKEKS